MGICNSKEEQTSSQTSTPMKSSTENVATAHTAPTTGTFTFDNRKVNAKIHRVTDGDTVDVIIKREDIIPYDNVIVTLRLDGLDTPEKHPRYTAEIAKHYKNVEVVREKEKKAAGNAENIMRQLLSSGVIQVSIEKWDKFGGRVDGAIFVDGKNMADEAVRIGIGKVYHGEKKQPWEEEELDKIAMLHL